MTPEPEHHERRPRVSVIMPTHGHEKIIGASIQSLLAQDYRDFELIVIDDESPDDTASVVARFQGPIRYIRQQNTGLPGARNTGLRAARGEIIALLDSDDLYEPAYLSTMVALLDGDPDASAAYCRARFIDMENRDLPQLTGEAVPPESFFEAQLGGNFLTPNCLVAYARCYREAGLFDTAIKTGEWDMWLEFARRYRVIGTNDILARYRVTPNSMSGANPLPMLEAQRAVLVKQLGGGNADPSAWAPAHRKAYWRAHILAATEYLQGGQDAEAFEQLQAALNGCPELLDDLALFYELAVGRQPRGYRGDFATWDMEDGRRTAVALLDRLFADSRTLPPVQQRKKAAYASLHLALGLMAYGGGRASAARGFLLQSVRHDPSFLTRPELNRALLRSLIPSWGLAVLRSRRRRAQTAA